jgi:MFS family permease
MRKKQLAALFMIDVAIITVGSVVSALLPIDAARLGADSTATGLFLAATFLGLALGTIAAGWLSDRLQRRKMFLISAGIVHIFVMWTMGQATTMTQLTLSSLCSTFLAGMQISLVGILAGLFAEKSKRGQVFGVIAAAGSLGGLLGGLAGGQIVDRWGFMGLFTVAAMVTALQPLAALVVEDKVVERVENRGTARSEATRAALLSPAFIFLFLASSLVFVSNSVHGLGRSLLMDSLGFDTSAISSTVAAGGLISLPLPFLIGWLSDRVKRKWLVMFCYVASVLSLISLVPSHVLWHFWASTALQSIVPISMGVGSAMVTDLFPPETLGLGLSLFGITNWIGLIIGSLGAGAAIQNLGMSSTLLVGALLAVVAVCLLLPIGQRRLSPAVGD